MGEMRIGQLAQRAGVSRDALRLYERLGLIASERLPNGYREYPPEMIGLVDHIRSARSLGFTLAEIAAEIPALSDKGLSAEQVAEILRGKIGLVEDRIAALEELRSSLLQRLNEVCPVHAARQRGEVAGQRSGKAAAAGSVRRPGT